MATRASGTVGPQFVAGDLLLDEAVVGLVRVEGLDHVIAVAPGIRAGFIGLEALAVGVAGEVEPVAAPALAVLRRGEQAVDHFFESLRRVVGQEGVDFLRRGRQAGEVEGGAAEQRDLVGRLRGLDALGFELGQDEGIDGSCGPTSSVFTTGGVCVFNLLERPEFALALGKRIGGEQQGATGKQS